MQSRADTYCESADRNQNPSYVTVDDDMNITSATVFELMVMVEELEELDRLDVVEEDAVYDVLG